MFLVHFCNLGSGYRGFWFLSFLFRPQIGTLHILLSIIQNLTVCSLHSQLNQSMGCVSCPVTAKGLTDPWMPSVGISPPAVSGLWILNLTWVCPASLVL